MSNKDTIDSLRKGREALEALSAEIDDPTNRAALKAATQARKDAISKWLLGRKSINDLTEYDTTAIEAAIQQMITDESDLNSTVTTRLESLTIPTYSTGTLENRRTPAVDRLIETASKEFKVDPNFAKAIVDVEQRGNTGKNGSPTPPGPVSHAGAIGWMQILPSTALEVDKDLTKPDPYPDIKLESLDPDDPEGDLKARYTAIYNKYAKRLWDTKTNIRWGVYYLSKMLRGTKGNLLQAAAAYNGGFGKLRSVGFDVGKMDPKETIPYASMVSGRTQELKSSIK